MAKKYWWQKVTDPDRIVQAAAAPIHDSRIRTATAIRYAGAFPDEPEIAQALSNSALPTALALRAFQGYQATKQVAITGIAAGAGYGPKSLTPELAKATEVKAAVDQPEPQGGAGFWDGVGTVAKVALGGVANGAAAVGHAAKNVGEGLMEGLNKVASPLTASAQAGYASDNGFDQFLGKTAMQNRGNPIGAGLAAISGVANTLEGAVKLAGGASVSPEQQADMRRANYNPDSAASRYAYYFQSMGNKRVPVSDTAITKLKADERFAPGDVDAAREIVSSGALNDLTRSADSLSEQARGLLDRAGSDQNAELLLRTVADHSQLTFGGNLVSMSAPERKAGDWLGQGSTSRTIAAAAADLIGYWYADPLVAVGGGVRAVRGATAVTEAGAGNALTRRWAYGVNAQSIDDVTTAIRATDDEFRPVGAVATRFDQAMDQADRIVRLNTSGKPEDAIEAGRAYADWTKLYPSMRPAFDTLIGMRSGAIGKLTIREATQAKEADRALQGGRNVAPWTIDAPSDGRPLWSLTDDTGNAISAELRAQERAKVADEMSAFILAEAYASGRELTHGRLLMPGQMSLNGALRNALGKFGVDLLMRRDRSAMRQLKDSKGAIDLNGGVGADLTGRYDQLLSPQAAEWMSKNYTFGLSHMFARGWRNFERTFSGKTVNPLDPNSTKVYGQLVSQFMPKRQAQMVTSQYAGANPGERYAMLRNTVSGFLNTINLRNTPEAQELVEQMTKGLIPSDRAINGYKAGGHEWYTTPDNNNIRVGDFRLAAGVHPWQMNEGLVLPNWREVRSLVDRGKVLNAVLGTVGPWGNSLNQAWKATKTASWANAARQGIEGFAFTAVRNPEALKGYRGARAAVKADLLTRKVNDNDLSRLANTVRNFNAEDLHLLEQARQKDPAVYASTMRSMLGRNGYDRGQADVLTRLSEDVDLNGLASANTFGVARLAMAGPIDFVRRIRAERAARKGGEVNDSPLAQYLDEETAAAFTENAFKQLGSAADNYVSSAERIDRATRQQVFSAAGRGYTKRPAKLVDAYKWLGSKSKVNHDMWSMELDKRFGDTANNLVMRLVAQRALDGWAEKARPKQVGEVAVDLDGLTASKMAQLLRQEKTGPLTAEHQAVVDAAARVQQLLQQQSALSGTMRASVTRELKKFRVDEVDDAGKTVTRYGPSGDELTHAQAEIQRINTEAAADPLLQSERFSSVDGLTRYLYSQHELGAGMRTNSARMQYLPNGELARSEAERAIAATRTAQTAVDDLVHHLGGTLTRDEEAGRTVVRFNEASKPLLEKIAAGQKPTPDDLARLPHEVYPEGLVHTMQVPTLAGQGSAAQKLANAASRAYGTIVAEPLAHMVMQPLFLAERRIAYGEVEPLMEQLVARGYSQGQAAYALEAMANNRAINRTFLSTDNPNEKSVFSELGDKYLMFQRAQEDFVRRFIGAATVNPGALGRANLMMTQAQHVGLLHNEPMQDEQGNTEYRLTFTYPGSALAQRVLMDAGVALGLAPEEMLRIPQFDGLKSQVRFINPGVANPLQFSANPVFGWAVDGMEKIWPSQRIELERLKRGAQGGEDFGGGQSALQQLMPAMLQRFVPLMQRDDADGQFASAFRTATMYAEAAGQLPGPDASPEEKSKALDAVKATATNILIMRAFTGTFLPASPTNADPSITDVDVLGRLQELPNIRAEWFQVKAELAKKYPDNYSRAYSEAQTEFARRYPGQLIVNPKAFAVGTVELLGTSDTGDAVTNVPYTLDGTRWMLENLDFVKNNPTVALALMPRDTTGGDFNNEAYKLQLKSELRQHKDLADFYRDVTLSDDISEYRMTTQKYSEAAKATSTAAAKGIYAKMEQFQDGWRRAHPLASAELDRRAEPNFVHAEMAPALERLATGQAQLPQGLEAYRPQITAMYQDWAVYRDKYLKVDFFNNGERASLNKMYRQRGNQQWLGTPLESLWKLVDVYEVS